MIINRSWAMPDHETFKIEPIKHLVWRYTFNKDTIIDPFARNSKMANFTNDMNPNTEAKYHFEAIEFLRMLVEQKLRADVILFDPPYSLRQAKECYDSFYPGGFLKAHSQNAGGWFEEKKLCYKLLKVGGYFLHFGWHTNGIGKKNHADIKEILIVAHGRSHNDTLCTVEQKLAEQHILDF